MPLMTPTSINNNANSANHTNHAKPSTYMPPSFRSKNPAPAPAPGLGPRSLTNPTQKTALKKGFALEATAFPSLGDTIKKSAPRGTPISFSSAAAKKVEPSPVKEVSEVLPGWVHIRKQAGQIQYKYGKPISRPDNEARLEQILSRIILTNRIAREQYDRNIELERLGDLSEFYGQPSLAEMYENEEFTMNHGNNDSGTDSDYDYANDYLE
jgi:hypothetical protein